MKKFKYPKVVKTYVEIKIPVKQENGEWRSALLHKDGSTTVQSFAAHETAQSCWVCCDAHNKRLGFSDEEVQQILKHYGKEQKETKKGQKAKAVEKAKATKKEKKKRPKKRDKASSRKERGLSGTGQVRKRKKRKKEA
jgi:hypothetical protein